MTKKPIKQSHVQFVKAMQRQEEVREIFVKPILNQCKTEERIINVHDADDWEYINQPELLAA